MTMLFVILAVIVLYLRAVVMIGRWWRAAERDRLTPTTVCFSV
jgi:hypothetical protein